MAYVYLLDMNKFVEQRLAGTKEALEKLEGNPSEKKFIEGRTSVLQEFQDLLLENYIPKLPRRIREIYIKRGN